MKKTKEQLEIFKYKGEPIRITLGTIVMIGICTFLIVIATFTQVKIPHFLHSTANLNFGEGIIDSTKGYLYIPQIPIILFIAGLMGRIFGTLSVLVYIAIGLFFYPIFALGGGLKYVLAFNFGYILAYIPAVFLTGTILNHGYSIKNVLKATVIGVLTIHVIGILYTAFIAIISSGDDLSIFGSIVAQSGWKILYDLIFSFIAVYMANITKKFLWLIMC